MSRKDFELIASVLRACGDPDDGRYTLLSAPQAFADALAATNPRFDRARFLKACGA